MRKQKKIMFFLSNLNGGGAQRTVINILKHLDRSKYEPSLILLNYNSNQAYANLVADDIPIININRRGRLAILKIASLIKKESPDLIFATLPQIVISVSIAHKLSKSNASLILRETNHRDKKEMSYINFQLLKWAYNYSSKVIALSKGVAKEMNTLYNLKSNKIATIYNPVDITTIKEISSKQKKVDRDPEKIRLIACGRLVPQKNFSILINSLAIVNRNFSNWELDILGEGPEKKKLEELVNYSNLKNKVKFRGFVDKPYVEMGNADLFILSSKWEGFGHVIVEAMATKTPVLATNCPHGPSEILSNNKYGWLVENDNINALSEQLLFLFRNRREIDKMRELAYNRANHFEAKKIVKEYEKVFSINY